MSKLETAPSLQSLYLRISPNRFHFLKFILEGYDNVVILSSVDSREGIVVLRYSAGHTDELFGLLAGVASELVD